MFLKTLLHYLKIINGERNTLTIYLKFYSRPIWKRTGNPCPWGFHWQPSLPAPCTFKGQTQVGHSSMITGNHKSRVFTRMSIPEHEFWRKPRLGKNCVSYPNYSYVPRSGDQRIGWIRYPNAQHSTRVEANLPPLTDPNTEFSVRNRDTF